MNYIELFIPIFALAIGFELLLNYRRGEKFYRVNDTINSISLGTLSTTSKLVLINIGALVYAWIQTTFDVAVWESVNWWMWGLAFIGYDFCYYWLHRMGHERKILWAAHVAHHQSEEYNLSTALRQTSCGFLLGWIFYIPCFLLGMPTELFVTVGSLNLIYQFWVHTRFVPELGPLEYLLVSPSNHRVHHARNKEYIDKNYGGVFILWDRIFGTYKREQADVPVDFGITRGLNSWNPLWANTHVYWEMFKDSLKTKRWSDKVRIWVGRTDYLPADIVKAPAEPGNAYNPPMLTAMRNYVLVQFFVLMVLGTLIKTIDPTQGQWQVPAVFIYLASALVSLGWLMEGRALWLEYLRLVAAPALAWLIYPDQMLWFGGYSLVSLMSLIWLSRKAPEPEGAAA